MKELPGFETQYETNVRFYNKDGKLDFVYDERFIFRVSAIQDAHEWLSEHSDDLNPCNVSVRGPDGRFIKRRN